MANAGAFEAVYGGEGLEELRLGPPEFPLAFFFLRLLHRLQRVGTVPAIDYDIYLQAFETAE